ncbi:acyl-CoA Delta-9 desaturase-like [Lasioglossum baleicum]|uniref:acyl-CoA Delta-9 desaturase-like n=1 Tax=Lasioglossum baleicum TaxID=434251 RepID=UPI003FCEA54A
MDLRLNKSTKMATKLFSRPATLNSETAQQGVHEEKSAAEKASSQKLTVQNSSASPAQKYKWNIVWRNVFITLYFHVATVYAIYLAFTVLKLSTILWMFIITVFAHLGVTAGAHRLWSHRAYKAKWPMRFILMIFQTIAFQNHIHEWVRDHRVHHKYTDTDADPYNARRGFFFSHLGWLLVRKQPDVFKKGATIDISDLNNDPIVIWQKKSTKMATNLFGRPGTLYLEAAQQGVYKEKSAAEKTSSQKLTVQNSSASPAQKYKWNLVWISVITFSYLHAAAVYGIYLAFTVIKLPTILWMFIIIQFATLGVTAGAHRLWSHRAYKAKWPMRFILMIFQTIAFQHSIYDWVRDHRVHHKFTDTDADPHNAKRGFFFSHMGWLLVRKHPEVLKKGATIDMSDLKNDPIVVWQKRLYVILIPLFAFIIPMWVPCYFFDEKPLYSWYAAVVRYTLSLHQVGLVNSVAHMWGMRPYDMSIGPAENIGVAIITFGEGWHNYHHVFPWDYKTAELGNYSTNFTTAFIDFFGKIGLAYDMKTIPSAVVQKRASRTGDGSKYGQAQEHVHSHEDAKWGWGDKDMESEEIKEVEIINKSN